MRSILAVMLAAVRLASPASATVAVSLVRDASGIQVSNGGYSTTCYIYISECTRTNGYTGEDFVDFPLTIQGLDGVQPFSGSGGTRDRLYGYSGSFTFSDGVLISSIVNASVSGNYLDSNTSISYNYASYATYINAGVRVGNVVLLPMPGVPEPGTWAMMIVGFAAAGLGVRHRRQISTAQDFRT